MYYELAVKELRQAKLSIEISNDLLNCGIEGEQWFRAIGRHLNHLEARRNAEDFLNKGR